MSKPCWRAMGTQRAIATLPVPRFISAWHSDMRSPAWANCSAGWRDIPGLLARQD